MGCRNCHAVRKVKTSDEKIDNFVKVLDEVEELYNKGKIKVTQAGLRSLMTKLKEAKEEALQCN